MENIATLRKYNKNNYYAKMPALLFGFGYDRLRSEGFLSIIFIENLKCRCECL